MVCVYVFPHAWGQHEHTSSKVGVRGFPLLLFILLRIEVGSIAEPGDSYFQLIKLANLPPIPPSRVLGV